MAELTMEESREVFAGTKLVSGYGSSPEAAKEAARAKVRALDLGDFVFTGRMGPDHLVVKTGYVFHAIYAEKAWWEEWKEKRGIGSGTQHT